MGAILEVLGSGTFRRLLVTGVGLLIPVLNKKFGWNLNTEEVALAVPTVLGYLWQSVSNEKHAREAGAAAAAAVTTVDDAAKVLGGAVKP